MNRTFRTLVGILTLAVIMTGCSDGGDKSALESVVAPPPSSAAGASPPPVVVDGRASTAVETDAPGIGFTFGEIEVTVNGHEITIPADDWNTISSESAVPHDIGLSLDPEIHASDTTRNRFQYLADLMVQYASSDKPTPVGVVAADHGPSLVTIVAVINRTTDTYRLGDLTVTVRMDPPMTTVGSVTVFSGVDNGLIVPGENISFLWLELPVQNSPPISSQSTHYDFKMGEIENCGKSPC